MVDIIFSLECPKCNFTGKAYLCKKPKFFIYTCPKCFSNVAYFKNKFGTLSNDFVKSLKNRNDLKLVGSLYSSSEHPRINKKPITKSDLIDLKILLNTETDFYSFISKI